MDEAKTPQPRAGPEARDGNNRSGSSASRAPRTETDAFLTLSAMRGIGPKTLFEWAEEGSSYRAILSEGPSDQPSGWRERRAEAADRAVKMRELLEHLQVRLILRSDREFPARLLELTRPPHWLFVQGSVDRLNEPSVAIVGTRKPSDDGIFLARYVGACLSDWSVPTVSGLAAGIDQLAHEESLRSGVPTIAVLGTGILEDYPKGSSGVRERILAGGGAIITEYLPRASYSGDNFVQRNRLQAALACILIPVEWKRRSGTAHTVRFASSLKRPIACLRLPYWPHDRVQFEPGLGLETGALFTVPREQDAFDRFVRDSIGETASEATKQLSLFGEDD
ncbi:DNA-processing protein DprA [Reyranella sp.]|jgi:DNA processing protein|uniref:DNA-processing protein DprA n=2 Tax=Reyranella sp. TaxID=1929291 RepID=UPI0026029922|nr:DNA-processing protein DprA [Reyranella sp.]HQS16974.1 DNA-processing protein DprA [Reyranella sp.]HQT15055.1 DNA-processing protein DprA [Reyranella sp.]|eukprot:Opistho-1_new@35505